VSATVERQEGSVTLMRGGVTVVLEPSGRQSASAPEGTEVTTLGDGRAHVRFFDDSTVTLESGTGIALNLVRRPQFATGDVPPRIDVSVAAPGETAARLSAGTAWHGTSFRILTRDAAFAVAPESRVQITVDASGTHAHAVVGSVQVAAGGATVLLEADQVTDVPSGGVPLRPRPALQDVLVNGDFRRPLHDAWEVRAHGEPLGAAVQEAVEGRTVLRLQRDRSEGRPGDVVLTQRFGPYDLSHASWLGVSTTLRIDSQSVPGGGERATEYPVGLRLVVERHDGSEDAPWDVGFYATNPARALPPPAPDFGVVAIPVPVGTWVEFRSGNLLDPSARAVLLGPDGLPLADEQVAAALAAIERFDLAPRRLLRFEVKGSGHDWLALVDRLGIWAK
jgi:hypothetical protein